MALLLLSTKSMTRSGVRAITLQQVAIGGVLGLTVFSLGAFGLGLIVGQRYAAAPVASGAAVATADPAKEHFTFSKLGDMAGRLVKLESDTRSLVKKLSALETLEKKLDEIHQTKGVQPAKSLGTYTNGTGGRMWAPQSCAEDTGNANAGNATRLVSTERQISCLQQLIGQVETATEARSVALMSLPARQPVEYNHIGSTFGNRVDPFTGRLAFHSGIDFSTDVGMPVRAAGGGRVTFAGWVNDLGNAVEIDHGNGLVSRYAHNSKLVVKQGDLVTPGQLIANSGSTGRSTGPHLHFEILKDGLFVDPAQYLSVGSQVSGV